VYQRINFFLKHSYRSFRLSAWILYGNQWGCVEAGTTTKLQRQVQMKRLTLTLAILSAVLTVTSWSHNAQAAPSDYFDTVQRVYIGYYQRPADPGGLLFWAQRISSTNGNLSDIIESYASSAESQALYGIINSSNIGTLVDSIYMALFNRPAEAEGKAYYTYGFNSGRYTAATIMLDVLYGAQNADLQMINNKLAAANLFTRTIDPELDGYTFQATYAGEGDAINARNFLASVTDDPATVPTQDETTAYMQNKITDPGDPLYGGGSFNFKRYLSGPPSTLSLSDLSLNTSTGEVVPNGGDTSRPSIPFTFDWGDGTSTDGWFGEAHHTYQDKTRNYLITVTSHYSNGTTDQAEIVAQFTVPTITPISLPSDIAVGIPDHMIALQTRLYGIPSNLTYFDDSFFTTVPRPTVEYVLTVAASIQKDFVNDNVFLYDNQFRQVMLRDPLFQGMYSLWFTSPVSFGVGDYGFQGSIGWSSFMHEMGHNFTLNTPSNYYYGGKIDGNANAIYSETLAQIFQHATTYEIINNSHFYGLSADLTQSIKESAIASIKIVRSAYDNYLNLGKPFSVWNVPSTPVDETVNTFMTVAYRFFEHAENDGLGYRVPVKRMLKLLQTFDQGLATGYDQSHDTSAAATFRATFMVTAVSYAFSKDLRAEFRSLNFPIDDQLYNELYQRGE
jgi:hypothetical protein